MKSAIVLTTFLTLLFGCSSNQSLLTSNNRIPTNSSSECLDIAKKIIASPSKKQSPESIETHYKNVISEKYQKEWSATNYDYVLEMWKTKQLKSKDIEVLEFFGFRFISEEELSAPTLEVFISNYKKYLDLKNIPEDERLYPAIVFERSKEYINGLNPSDTTLTPGKKLNRLIYNPLIPSSENSKDWSFLRNPRLTGQEMEESLAAGKFPVFSSGLHDVYHFIIFATNPEYVKILREKSKELLKTKITRSMISRNAYTLEILSLGNPEKLSEIVKKIAIPNPTEKTTYEDFLRATQALSKEELNEKAQFWKENYKNYLISYNSAGRYPKEKISTSAYVYLDYIQYHFNNDVNLVPAPVKKPFVNQMFTEGMEYMDKVLQLLTETDPDVLKRIATEYKSSLDPENMLQIHIARMEYALWKSATTINLNQWTNDILTPTVDINSPTMKFIKDSFGKHSYIYNMFQ